MGRDCNIRLIALEKSDKRVRIEPIKGQANRVILRGVVKVVIQPAEDLGVLLTRSI